MQRRDAAIVYFVIQTRTGPHGQKQRGRTLVLRPPHIEWPNEDAQRVRWSARAISDVASERASVVTARRRPTIDPAIAAIKEINIAANVIQAALVAPS